ncbi:hypothetical protein [Streptomyces sp. CCM_MD2014]|uniref:hypothetical protein n=1 Tax=Streptomyces sp. CCM_MD2014 TaxID=1561022 RepID=UPI00052AD47B|nr:hypothetical protein [Streptomyces sp. CCM_MD2014]AIV34732.1 hypothetical protein NI25_15445 [Streptomyces sp. CCM_MD2014]
MIVFPRLLSDLLDQTAPSRAAHHALDFTQHVLDLERAETAEPVLDACLGFVAAAHEAIDLGETHMRYARACTVRLVDHAAMPTRRFRDVRLAAECPSAADHSSR